MSRLAHDGILRLTGMADLSAEARLLAAQLAEAVQLAEGDSLDALEARIWLRRAGPDVLAALGGDAAAERYQPKLQERTKSVNTQGLQEMYAAELDAARRLLAGVGPELAAELDAEIEASRARRRAAARHSQPLRDEAARLDTEAGKLEQRILHLLGEAAEIAGTWFVPVQSRYRHELALFGIDPGKSGERTPLKLARTRPQVLRREAERLRREADQIDNAPQPESGELRATSVAEILAAIETFDAARICPRYDVVARWLRRTAGGFGDDVRLDIVLAWDDGDTISPRSRVMVAAFAPAAADAGQTVGGTLP